MGVTLFCVVFAHDPGKGLPLRLRAEYAITPDSAIEQIIMHFIQAFSPANKVRMSIPHPCGMGLK